VAQRLVQSRAGVEEILHLDLSAAMLDRARAAYDGARAAARDGDKWPRVRYIQADEELLPLEPESVDRGSQCWKAPQ
jgi:ubiquinone/menaquinone biosynthesis C-methylase UbiE